MTNKAFAATLLVLLGVSFLFMSFPPAFGQLGINIYTVTPTQAIAGEEINVQGTIDTSNGEYRLYLGNALVASNTSEGFYVNANFTVPELPGGDYTLILRDVARRINATSTFSIQTGYFIKAIKPSSPSQLQEGNEVALNVTVTGGNSGTTYYANVTVALPDPLLTEYSQVVILSPSSQTGTGHTQITFPNNASQPSGSNTNFTGIYKAYFNKTQELAVDEFFVGFTNAAEYHRDQFVVIRAVGYQPGQSSALKIVNQASGGTVYTETVTASNVGTINASWTVPSDAAIGTYQVTITPEGTQKSIVDTQTFSVPGFPVRFRTLNLAGEIVPQIFVEATDQATGTVYSGTSGSDGLASINLEKGTHNVSAYWNDVRVGQIGVSITGESQLDLTSELTNLKITVQDKNGFLIPSVTLRISYRYTTTKDGTSRTGSASGQTDIAGNFHLNSTLPKIDYTINASVYGRVFNSANNTFSNIPAAPNYNVIILFPSQNLTLTILDYNQEAIPNARLAMGEITSGIFYVASTDTEGSADMEVAFGVYQLRIYKDTVLLNETIIEVFSNIQTDIRCILYNLPVSVLVVDYFGQPIPNMNVVYKGPDGTTRSETTQANGIAMFNNVIGGDIQIIAYPTGLENYYEAVNLQVDSSTAVQVKMGKYILLGVFLIDISMFATLVIILVLVILFLVLELYRRRKLKPAEAKTNTNSNAK
ncbi:MAG TPA: hypothetical protein VJL33_08190 [Candidatus Bathyarchaeia archaeon]|nr:hypothetical protein [Candidatus Bathyarchaeia archaeon]